MAQAAPAYRYPEYEPKRSPRIQVVPGRGKVSDGLPSSLIMAAKILAVFLVVFALIGFARIGLASATVTTTVASEEISTQIESARSAGNNLEVRESHLSNPSYLKAEATKLKMREAGGTASLVLGEDIVKTDTEGNLSLARSLKAATLG